jgi:hypothetical protein
MPKGGDKTKLLTPAELEGEAELLTQKKLAEAAVEEEAELLTPEAVQYANVFEAEAGGGPKAQEIAESNMTTGLDPDAFARRTEYDDRITASTVNPLHSRAAKKLAGIKSLKAELKTQKEGHKMKK